MKTSTVPETTTHIIQQLIRLRGVEIKKIADLWGVSRVTVYSYIETPGRMVDSQIQILADELKIKRKVLDDILVGKISTIGNALAAV